MVVDRVMITELTSDPGNLPANSFSKFLNDVGEKILGGTAVGIDLALERGEDDPARTGSRPPRG